MRINYFVFTLVILSACAGSKNARLNMKPIDIFKEIITGDFDNSKQVAAEIESGKQVHPLAKHVNRIADGKIKNLPKNSNGFFVLEESYYTYPGKTVELKPFLFQFSAYGDKQVKLTVYQLPAGPAKASIRNDNSALSFDYNELKLSPTFKEAVYDFVNGNFVTNTAAELGNGIMFTLTETLGKEKLLVMELLEKAGKRITPYDTPIVYDRKN